ncbi:hypothetical protein AB1Y20_019949 [Prymnesium parvum]|uniref:ShKT domain-containing protein n=1 Tax=Prymnesium parvum TaxID=97485 RepID=A0AB34JWJ7_PRYPA
MLAACTELKTTLQTAKACCAVDEKLLCPFLMEPDMGECCVLGCGLCTYGLKVPSTCCNSWSRCLCFVSAESFPCTDSAWVEACMCASYGINCAPQCGCCSAPKSAIPTMIGVAKGQAETQAMDRP